MLRKVFKTGNSVVVALPREMLDALHIVEGKEVSVDLDIEHGQITIAPVAPAVDSIDTDFARQVAEFIDNYRPALEALAK